jgi:glucose-6-phosphate dehydrogenase assembly protein OpcA
MSITVDIERELAALREADRTVTLVRTSTMTHLAWVPAEWLDAALATLSGLSEQHPSRTILLVPLPDAPDDVEYDVRLVSFVLGSLGREVCSEVITLRLGGCRIQAAASLVLPLLRPNLPVFMRWRGRPPFGKEEFESLVDVVDRLVIDSSEWPDVPGAYRPLVSYFDKAAVSDIAWARGEPWRLALADLWPGIAEVAELSVVGPHADALLLAGWLESRLARRIRLVHEQARVVERVAANGVDVEAPDHVGAASGSELLSRELERLARDRVYEQAAWVCAGEVVPTPTSSAAAS